MKSFNILVGAIFLLIGTAISANAAPKTITWEDLIPSGSNKFVVDFNKTSKMKGLPNISEFNGSKEDRDEYVLYMSAMREMQPTHGFELAGNLNGKEVKIAGYVTPLSFDGDKLVDFLFVPYLGACAHVPAPPANQIVYVEGSTGLNAADVYDPVWLTGKLNVTPVSTFLANVGYSIKGAKLETYDE